MQAQRTTGPDPASRDEAASAVHAILLERYPALVELDELVRDLVGPKLPAIFVHEALDELVRAGLAHRLDRFAFASHAAVRGRALGQ
jgi:hypothetical protein